MLPKVSIITPTTHGRAHFNTRIADIVRRQGYAGEIEHLFDYGKGTIGAKLNRLCEAATGEIIMRFDSDDRYACDWVYRTISEIQSHPQYDVYGLKDAYYTGGWKYTGGKHNGIILGATMAFRKTYWERMKFADSSMGEDGAYCRKAKVYSLPYVDGFLATLHDGNTSVKNLTSAGWSRVNL